MASAQVPNAHSLPPAIGVRSERDSGDRVIPHDHAVQFYDGEGFLATVVAEFVVDGLTGEQPVVIIATPAHRGAIVRRLREAGFDVAHARRTGQLQLLDARRALSKFMVAGIPNPERFSAAMGSIIVNGLRGREGAKVRAYGEMVDLLWKDGNTESAVQLERLWNELARQYEFSLLCAYSMGNFCHASDADAFRRVCAEHSHVTPTETYSAVGEADRLLEISRLQQRARSFEAEVAERQLIERRLRDVVLELNEREAELREREADLRDVLDNAAEGIHLVGPNGIIEWANAAELEMLGYTAEEYIGHNIAEFHADQPVIERILVCLAAGETLRSLDVRLRHKNGSIRHILLNSNVRFRNGQFLHTRCFSRDITELRSAAQEREEALAAEQAARVDADRARAEAIQARAVAEQANRAKSEFLAVMSHELRTPLNAIGGYAELMELGVHGQVTPEQREALDRIQRSQRMLLGLINQVLNYARLETGSVRYELTSIPLGEVLQSACSLVTPQLRTKGLRFAMPAVAADVVVRADEEKLQQIVLNLLTNAVKFTDRGGQIRLDVDADEREARVRVSDSGIGIPTDKLDVIFEPFVQVDAKYTRTRDGVGLGLAISRDLARGMGGSLVVESVEGEGSTFTLTLPLCAASD
jgi:PAS domain S-box-containing protein